MSDGTFWPALADECELVSGIDGGVLRLYLIGPPGDGILDFQRPVYRYSTERGGPDVIHEDAPSGGRTLVRADAVIAFRVYPGPSPRPEPGTPGGGPSL